MSSSREDAISAFHAVIVSPQVLIASPEVQWVRVGGLTWGSGDPADSVDITLPVRSRARPNASGMFQSCSAAERTSRHICAAAAAAQCRAPPRERTAAKEGA